MFLVPWCVVCYDYHVKTMSALSLSHLFLGVYVCILFLYLFIHSNIKSLVEQELPEYLSSPPILVGSWLFSLQFLCSVLYILLYYFVIFHLTIVLSVLTNKQLSALVVVL
jgi:hypothetical protein